MELVKRDQESLFKSFVDASTEFNKKRAKLLMQQLEELVEDLYNEEDEELREALLDTIHIPAQKEWTKYIKSMITESTLKGSDRAGKEINQLMRKFSEGNSTFGNILPIEALNYIDTYSPIIAGITDDTTKNAIKGVLKDSLKDGNNLRSTMTNVATAVNGQLSVDRLENIARTESMKFYNAGRIQRYTDPGLDDFVAALQYDSIMDARTTTICSDLDGKIVDINDRATIEKFTPPNHYMCRATWMPVSKYENVTPDWPSGAETQPGFNTTPDLFGGSQAAVRQVPVKDPNKMSIAQIRKMKPEDWDNLPDEAFKANIRKVKDPEERLNLSMVRAQKMFKEKAGFNPEESVVPNIRIVHNVQGMSFYVDGKQNQVKIGDDKFAGQIAKLFSDGIKDGKIELGDFIDSPVGAPYMRDIENAARKINELLEGAAPKLDFNILYGTGADPSEIFGKMKLKQINKNPNLKTQVANRTKEIKRARLEAEEWIANNFDPNNFTPDFRKRFIQIDYGSNRSNAGKLSINMAGGRAIEPRVLVHELMHTMTFNNQPMEDAAQAFFRRQTKGLKIEKINMHGEVGIKDGFYNPYVGRVYEFDKNDPKGYEVMSMGAEAMFSEPEMFLLQDPDHFWFTYAMMQGLY